jgi:hypothetical protein
VKIGSHVEVLGDDDVTEAGTHESGYTVEAHLKPISCDGEGIAFELSINPKSCFVTYSSGLYPYPTSQDCLRQDSWAELALARSSFRQSWNGTVDFDSLALVAEQHLDGDNDELMHFIRGAFSFDKVTGCLSASVR